MGNFLERDVVHNQKKYLKKTTVRGKVENFRVVFAPFVQSGEALSPGRERSDNCRPNPRRFSIQTEEAGTSRRTSRENYHAGNEFDSNNGHQEIRICFSEGNRLFDVAS